jgi:hypothetical protein
MDSTSESEFVSAVSPETTLRQAGDVSPVSAPYKGGDRDNRRAERTGKARVEYSIALRAETGNWQTPPVLRLKALLKAALRRYGLRCVSCRPTAPADETAPGTRHETQERRQPV